MAIFALCLVLFINALTLGLVIPVFAPMLTVANSPLFDPGTSAAIRNFAYTALLALPVLFMMFGSPLLGSLSDQYGRKRILTISLLGIALGLLLSVVGILTSSLVILFLSRCLVGFMDGCEAIAQASIADLSTPENKAKNMSKVTLAMVFGFVIGPISGGVLADHNLVSWFNYNTPFIVALMLTLINVVLLRLYYRNTLLQAHTQKRNYWRVMANVFSAAFDKRVRAFVIIYLAMEIGWATFFQTTSLLLADHYHYTPSQIGLFLTYLSIVFAFSLGVLLPVLLRLLAHWMIILFGMLALASGFLCLTLALHHIYWIYAAVVPCGIGMSMTYNVLLSMFSNSVNPNEQGWIMGGLTALIALSWLIATLLNALFTGRISGLFGLLVILSLVGAGTILFNKKTRMPAIKTVEEGLEN
ncbi:MAG: MFS transporter [Legionellales bacterium]|nr:MFS transporter [Legionellales bacterium]